MYIYQDVYIEGAVIGYFVICIVVCSFLLLNMTIAVMLTKYEELYSELDKKDNKESGGVLHELADEANLPKKLEAFLRTSQDIKVSQEAKDKLENRGEETSLMNQLLHYGEIPSETVSD